MATKGILDKLSNRIDELAAAIDPAPGVVMIEVPDTLDQKEVLDRHFRLYPAARRAEKILALRSYHDDPDYFDVKDGKPEISRAWREIAREEVAKFAPDELRLLRGRRLLKRIAEAENVPPALQRDHQYRRARGLA